MRWLRPNLRIDNPLRGLVVRIVFLRGFTVTPSFRSGHSHRSIPTVSPESRRRAVAGGFSSADSKCAEDMLVVSGSKLDPETIHEITRNRTNKQPVQFRVFSWIVLPLERQSLKIENDPLAIPNSSRESCSFHFFAAPSRSVFCRSERMECFKAA